MALLSVSTNVFRLFPSQPSLLKNLCKPDLGNYFPILSANLSGKAYREVKNKPPPFPYKEKKYSILRSFFDRTTHRFDENSKIIVVEGPVACGKTTVAQQLAAELDMLHIPEANMDTVYINHIGYNLRQLDPQLPESTRSFDETNFCKDPTHVNAAAFQIWMYRLRFSQYIDALAHVLSTGQGVVLERCPWSDMVFVESMTKMNYIRKEAQEAYYIVKDHTINHLMKPHLVVYLDTAVDKVLENIKKRNKPHEVNGKALTKPYLEHMEEVYKTQYLKQISEHAELLIYDWSEGGDVETIVEDMERIDFDKYTKHDKKLRDWKMAKEQNWASARMLFADGKEFLMSLFNVPTLNAPEMFASGDDLYHYNKVWFNAPGMKYDAEYDPKVKGMMNLLFKTKPPKYLPY